MLWRKQMRARHGRDRGEFPAFGFVRHSDSRLEAVDAGGAPFAQVISRPAVAAKMIVLTLAIFARSPRIVRGEGSVDSAAFPCIGTRLPGFITLFDPVELTDRIRTHA